MSFQRSHGNIEEVETSYVQPCSDVHKASTVELLGYPSNVDSAQLGTGFNATTPPRALVRGKQRMKLWNRIANPFSDWWMGELLAILVSIVTFIAIVIILRKYDNRTLQKLPQNVSLNFVVSTLATVSKSSLLLAVASAIGQFKWLWISAKYHPLRDLQILMKQAEAPWGLPNCLHPELACKSGSW